MSWTFNPPPGWPEQPPGWVPPPGWTPEPGWPPPPAGWQFWVPADQPTPTPTPSPMPTPTPAAVHGYPPAQPYPGWGPPHRTGDRAWFARWWGVLTLVGALVIGGLLGFGGTSLGLAATGEDDPSPAPAPAPAPAPTQTPELDLPTLPPIPTEPPAGASAVCGEVAVIMLVMLGEQLNASEADDPRGALAESRRTAATGLRDLETDDPTEREALDTFADELDSAADYVERGAFTEGRLDEFLTRSTDAWDDFNATAGC